MLSNKKSKLITKTKNKHDQSGDNFHNYWIFHGLFASHRQIANNISTEKHRGHLWYLKKQILLHYLKNFFSFPVWLIKLITPDYMKGQVNVWTNIRTIAKKPEFKPLRLAILSQLFFLYAIIHLGIFVFYYHSTPTLAATYNLTQTTWSGGVSTTLTATHPPSALTYYYSKSDNIDTSNNELKLAFTAQTPRAQTLEADFTAAVTSTNTYVSGGNLVMLKPLTATCSASAECVSTYCDTTCQTPPVPCDGTGGTHTCGNRCTYNSYAYATALIDTQCWFAENLRTTKYADGSDITLGPTASSSDWTSKETMYYSCPPNSANNGPATACADAADSNGKVLGLLYQWKTAVNSSTSVGSGAGPQGICPGGWQIPTENGATTSGWGLLRATVTTLCGAGQQGTCVKTGAANFGAPLSGMRDTNGSYSNYNVVGRFWSATLSGNYGYIRYVATDASTFDSATQARASAAAVRCLKN